MRALIVGCGYVGLSLAKELRRLGHEVVGVRRSPVAQADAEATGIAFVTADLSKPETLAAIPGPFDWVVNTVSAGMGGVAEYRQTYLEGTRNLLQWLRNSPPKKYVYTSSTGVYGQTDGSVVKEDGPLAPPTDTGVVLKETEDLLLAAYREWKFPAVILRVAGIYGPDRGYYFRQYLEGTARIEGDGSRYLNMIHQEDVAGVILEALKASRPGEVFNAVDDEPVTQLHFFRWLSETLGKDMPPFDPAAAQVERKRGWTNKRVANRKLKMLLGYRFRYPTFRQGYTAEIQRMEALP